MKLHFLSGGRLRMRRSIYRREAAKGETIDLPVWCGLIRHAQGNVLFDTGCHPQAATQAETRWGALARAVAPIFEAGETVVPGLATIGLQPADIDVVICSHFHPDHCGCNALFPRARLICQRAELAAAQAEGAEARGYVAADWKHLDRLEAIDGAMDLFGDGRILLQPLPGHTPGQMGARVRLEGGDFLLASDAAALQVHLDEDYAPRNTWDVGQAMASLATIRAARAAGATVVFGHDLAQWDSLRKGADCYA